MLDAILLQIPAIVKSKTDKDGRRLVEVQCSSEDVDAEGDVILQSALLNSGDSFIKSGHLDLDHLSELGARLGIPNPTSFIVGRPTELKDLGNKRTSVVGEIMRSADGKHDPKANRYDEFWDSLQSDPPVKWSASIYGFPLESETVDCRKSACEKGATRFLVKGMDLRSIAFTRSPVNTSLTGYAKIVSAKSRIIELQKGMYSGGDMGLAITPSHAAAGAVVDSQTQVPQMPYSAQGPTLSPPISMDEAVGYYHRHMMKDDNPHTGGKATRAGFKSFFTIACGCSHDHADLLSHALMYYHLLEKDRARK